MIEETGSYLGQAESPRLEFKRAEASLDQILAAVVAFLNAGGGEVVVGVEAPGPEAIAVAEPGVPEPYRLKDAVEQAIPSRIEPPPEPGAIEVVTQRTPSGTRLVRIGVKKSDQGPHALRHGNTVAFWVREGSHRRTLSVPEVYQRRARDGEPDALARSEEAFQQGLACARTAAGAGAALFVGFQPMRVPQLSEREWIEVRKRFMKELRSETPLGVRPGGFTFALWPHWQPEMRKDRVAMGCDRPLFRFVEVRRSGTVWGAWGDEILSRPMPRGKEGSVVLIHPIIVSEFVVSVARLAVFAMTELGIAGGAIGRMALFSPEPVVLIGRGDLGLFNALMFGKPIGDLPIDTGPISWETVMEDASPTDLVRELLTRWFDLAGNADAWRAFRDRDGRWSFS